MGFDWTGEIDLVIVLMEEQYGFGSGVMHLGLDGSLYELYITSLMVKWSLRMECKWINFCCLLTRLYLMPFILFLAIRFNYIKAYLINLIL